jgi:putative molybdopterin biosynthesis protein
MNEIYLHDIPLDKAIKRLSQALEDIGCANILGEEEIPLDERAVGRVLSKPVWAKASSPGYHASAMDGFAVRSQDTNGAMPTFPVLLDCPNQAIYVDTGDLMPSWANAVIPIEMIESLTKSGEMAMDLREPEQIRIRSAIVPWRNVRPLGEDIVATELVIPSGHTLRPVDLGAVAAAGLTTVHVARKPRVSILPTGTELKAIGESVQPGEIIEFNSVVMAAQIILWGGVPVRYPITPDNFETIRSRAKQAAQNSDLILLNAGSSAGSEDFSAKVVESLGKLLVHGVAVRPGHPVIIGIIPRQNGSWIPVIGVPGFPVSAALTGEIFIEPMISRWLGRQAQELVEVDAILTRKTTSAGGDDDYIRMVVGKVEDRFLATPLTRGAGVISSLVRADGITIIPRGSQGLPAGSHVRVRLYRTIAEIERTILAIGSHDMILDLLAQELSGRNRRLASANVGSLGGLIALRRGEAHLAGSHLLDPKTGEYNIRYIQEYLPDTPVFLVGLAHREQGLLVRKGNPKGILGIDDLTRSDIVYVNRQRGAGTRVLLDYQLDLLGIEPELIQGYDQEEFTHLSIAASVASQRADCGLGIKAAAKALDLDFIPLFQERYDLVFPKKYIETTLLEPLMDLFNDKKFQRSVAQVPGYDPTCMGEVIADLE